MRNPLLAIDFYKADHRRQYPKGTNKVYSNFTPRSNRLYKGELNKVVVFGLQMFIKDYLIKEWNEGFFQRDKQEVLEEYKTFMDCTLGLDAIPVEHISELWELGYLPIEIKSLPEGSLCPMKVPVLTITNTDDRFFWLVNYLETVMSTELWKPMTNATIAYEYRQVFEKFADMTGANKEFILFQGHDFSCRGLSNREDGYKSGIAHLTSFVGTDTVLAIQGAKDFYNADYSKELVGTSVPATEHSVMCMGTKDSEIETFRRLITELYPSGVVSIVSDTWDLWKVLTEYTVELKDEIINRKENSLGLAKVVFRPDCYDEQTLIMTDSGWKYLKDLTNIDLVAQVLDDGSYEFIKPLKTTVQLYEGEMCHFKDQKGKVDLLVTPNHRMILQQNDKERIVLAEDLGYKGHHKQKMVRSASARSLPSRRITPNQRLMIAFQADGSYTSTGNKIRFKFSKQRKIDRLKNILEDCNISHTIYELKDGCVEININTDATAYQKDFEWVKKLELTKEWCQDFIEELSYWDATRRSDLRFKFDTTVETVNDVVEVIAIGAGYGIYQSKREDNRKPHFSTIYTSHIMKDNTIGGQSWVKEITNYTGYVYCVTVPSGRLLVKRNKCIMVCGNSGNPVDILCGTGPTSDLNIPTHIEKGAVGVLWDIFGGTINDKGFKTLNPRVGLIYGDSITLERQQEILQKLRDKGFASDNIVFGIGSYTYQYSTRDTFGFAMKATYGEVEGIGREIFKDPITDSGTKKSAKGLLFVKKDEPNGDYYLIDSVAKDRESSENNKLKLVFKNGELIKETSLKEIRERLA